MFETTLVFARDLERSRTPESLERFDRDAWRQCASHGLLGLCMPQEYGGIGGDALGAIAAYDALGEGHRDNGLAFGLSGQLMSCQVPLATRGSSFLKERYLPAIIRGELVVAHGASEADTGSDVKSVQTRAKKVTGGYRVSGAKMYSTLAPESDLAIILCRIEGSDDLVELLLLRQDYSVGPVMAKVGMASAPFAEIVLEDVFVPEDHVVGRPGEGLMAFMAAMEWERLGVMAASVGAMRRQLGECVSYAQTRKQFSAPIGTFQAVSHRIAEMRLRHDTSRLLLYASAAKKAAGRPTPMESALTKLHVSESRNANSQDAMRLFGAYGATKESGIEAEFRDSILGLTYSGTSDIQREVVARMLGLGRSRA